MMQSDIWRSMMHLHRRVALKSAPAKPNVRKVRLISRRMMQDGGFAPIAMHEPTYSLGAACALAGVDPRRVTNWLQRDKLTLGHKAGPKKVQIAPWDVFRLALIGKLVESTTIENASAVGSDVFAHLRKLIDKQGITSVYPFAKWMDSQALILFSFAPGRFAIGDGGKIIDDARRTMPLSSFVFVPLGEAISRTSAKMHGSG